MNINKTIILIVIFLMTIISGCNSNEDNLLNEPILEDIEQEEKLEYGDINDYTELEKLWQDYFYHSIATIGNNKGFNSGEDIDPFNVVKFCWFKYVVEQGKESLELVSNDSYLRFFPLHIVLDYAERYFNLTSLDLTKIEEGVYDFEKKAFILDLGSERETPSHTDRNSWATYLDQVIRNIDGTVTAILVNYDNYQNRRVQFTDTYILKPRTDGSLYFVSCRRDYVNNHLVSLIGDYQHFEKIEDSEENIGELSMLGEDNNKVIMAKMSYGKEENAALLLLNTETLQMEKMLNLNSNLAHYDVSMDDDKIVIRFKDRIMLITKGLEILEEIPLPEAIKKKIEREPKYDKDGFPDIYFGGYDVSKDLKNIIYSDEIGLKLLNLADGSEILLSPTVPLTGSELLKESYHSNPRFVANDQKVITTMTGYESTRGYTLCSLIDGTTRNYDISSESSSTAFIRYNTGLLEVGYKSYYLDFKTGDLKEIELGDTGETGYIRPSDHSYVGQNYAAFITSEWSQTDYTENMSYLNRLSLETFEVEPELITVKAAETHILGVLSDGRIVFSYNFYPCENGLCITSL